MASTITSAYAIFAYAQVSIATHAQVKGRIGVRDNKPSGAELVVGSHARVDGDLLADRIEIESHASIAGTVSGNSFSIHKKAELSHVPSSPLALPLDDVTPAMPPAKPGTQDVSVPSGKTITLGAGTYRAVLVSSGQATQLELSGGLYELSSLELGQQARLRCRSTCELRVKGSLTLAEHAKLVPVAGMAPAEVKISVDGGGQQGVQVKPHAELAAHLVARNTGFTLGAHGILRGNVIAVTVAIGPHAILNSFADAVEPVVDATDATSEVKTPPEPEGSTLPPPDPKEVAALVAKQQAYVTLVKQKLQNEWKGLSSEELDAARTALKESMLGVQP